MSTLALDNIGLLATNDPAVGEGPLGLVEDAALVFAASAADVRHVIVDGRGVVRDGEHVTIDVPRELHESVRRAAP